MRLASRKTGRRMPRVPTYPTLSDILPGRDCSTERSIWCVYGGTKFGSSPWKLCGPSLVGPLTAVAAPPSGCRAEDNEGPVGRKGTLGYCRAVAVSGTAGHVEVDVPVLFL